jgi:hypothetical protein
MQLVILIHHITGASQVTSIYMMMRVLLSAFLFLNGYAHFHFYWKQQQQQQQQQHEKQQKFSENHANATNSGYAGLIRFLTVSETILKSLGSKKSVGQFD